MRTMVMLMGFSRLRNLDRSSGDVAGFSAADPVLLGCGSDPRTAGRDRREEIRRSRTRAGPFGCFERRSGLPGGHLAPGLHLGYFPWQYRISKCRVTVVPQGEIALVVAADGAAYSSRTNSRTHRRMRQLPGRAQVPDERWRERPPTWDPDRGNISHQPGVVHRHHFSHRNGARDDWGSTASAPRRAGHGGNCDHAGWPAHRSRGNRRAGDCRARKLPKRAGVSGRRRPARVAGADPALRHVEPEPLVCAGGTGADGANPHRLCRRGDLLRRPGARGRQRARVQTRRPRGIRAQRRLGYPAVSGQTSAQHERDEGGVGADHEHRAQLGHSHRSASL